jgi:long-chain acyl-CoA synthetase
MSNYKRLIDLITNYQKEFAKDIMVAGRASTGWKTFSTKEFVDIIDSISKGLLAKGLKKGDRVALMSGNRPEWNFIDFACNQLGVATVPLYPTLSNQDLIYILNDAEVKLLFVSNDELSKKAEAALKENNLDIEMFTFDEIQGRKNFQEVIQLGKQNDQELQQYRDAVSHDDLLTLIYVWYHRKTKRCLSFTWQHYCEC